MRLTEELIIPRAMSVRTNSPLWRSDCFEIGPLFDVMLDGEPVAHVIAYDCDEGWVQRFKPDENGRKQLNESGNGALEEVLHGALTVQPRSQPA